MRSIFKIAAAITGIAVGLVACDKADNLPFYTPGINPALTVSSTTIAPAPADSNNVALTANWTFPKHATDSASIKYTIEIDSTGKNFARATTKIVMGALTTSFKAKELNSILLSYGYAFNVPVDMDVRVISSYGNNNERLTSNVIKIRMTPYKIPPKVALPSTGRLFIVGGATQGGWTNPVPVPTQELTRMDETTFAGIFRLTGGQSYLLLPENGVWSKYGAIGANNSNNPAGDDFKPEGGDLMAPATTGDYKIVVDFQAGKFSVTSVANALSPDLYITGDATVAGWVNNPPANQKFTQLTNGVFEITQTFAPGKYYKFLNTSGQWQPQFGGSSATGGTMGANYGTGTDPASIPTPAAAGAYKVKVNFLTNTYTVSQ
jgi:starch-binding outer membrane protein SusE/F